MMLSLLGSTVLAGSSPAGDTCHAIKSAYQSSSCCNSNLQQVTNYMVSPPPPTPMGMDLPNPCAGKKPYDASPGDGYFNNVNCTSLEGVLQVLEQAGANVTAGYVGGFDTGTRAPLTSQYWEAGLCPVNVHWHLGAEHLSVGEYD